MPHLICFAMKSNSNHGGDRAHGARSARGWTWCRAANTAARGRRACRASGSCSRASARRAEEMRLALEGGIRQFNVESEPELRRAVRGGGGRWARWRPITVRVNPDVDAKTHAKIATGKSENKFGIPISRAREVYAEAARLPGIEVVGIDVHIGSQLTDLAPVRGGLPQGGRTDAGAARRRPRHPPARPRRRAGHSLRALERGAAACPFDYGDGDPPHRGHLGCEIEIEPGRLIAGNAGILRLRGDLRQAGRGAGLPDPRRGDERPGPAGDVRRLARHRAGGRAARGRDLAPLRRGRAGLRDGRHLRPRPRPCRRVAEGDLVAFRSAGAYGAVMASEYNTRPAGPRGAGEGRSLRGHPREDRPLTRSSGAIPFPRGSDALWCAWRYAREANDRSDRPSGRRRSAAPAPAPAHAGGASGGARDAGLLAALVHRDGGARGADDGSAGIRFPWRPSGPPPSPRSAGRRGRSGAVSAPSAGLPAPTRRSGLTARSPAARSPRFPTRRPSARATPRRRPSGAPTSCAWPNAPRPRAPSRPTSAFPPAIPSRSATWRSSPSSWRSSSAPSGASPA